MKFRPTIVKTAQAVFTGALFALIGVTGAAHAQTLTQTVFAAATGDTAVAASGDINGSPGSEFSFDVVYSDNHTSRTVVSFYMHYDSSILEFVSTSAVRPIADAADTACLVGSDQPPDVQSADENLKIGGLALAAADVDATKADGALAANDSAVNPTWAQICGDVFATGNATKLFTATFKWKDDTAGQAAADAGTSTMITFTEANGGDFAFDAFDGTALTVTPQTFTVDVDASGAANAQDGVMIARYMVLGSRGAAVTAGQTSADQADVNAAIASGGDLLDVDASGAANAQDGVMIARYMVLGSRGAAVTAGQTSADQADVNAAIADLVP